MSQPRAAYVLRPFLDATAEVSRLETRGDDTRPLVPGVPPRWHRGEHE